MLLPGGKDRLGVHLFLLMLLIPYVQFLVEQLNFFVCNHYEIFLLLFRFFNLAESIMAVSFLISKHPFPLSKPSPLHWLT